MKRTADMDRIAPKSLVTQTVPVDSVLLAKVREAALKYGFRIRALVEQGIQMRLDALAREKK
jgi:hypothetical protein